MYSGGKYVFRFVFLWKSGKKQKKNPGQLSRVNSSVKKRGRGRLRLKFVVLLSYKTYYTHKYLYCVCFL